jgi:acetylornithine deacetylase/succinyl-diaminopimelate desuccinylase-like protein
MPLDVVETLRNLVRIPSVNPMGRNVSGPEFFEYAVTDHLERLFTSLKLPWERHEVAPLRTNILVRVDGETPPEKGGKLLLFEAHQDTVPVDGMIIPPWGAEVREGRVYGRGSCDIKGGMAAMLSAVARLAQERPPERPTVVLACTVNEEHGFTGATHLTKLWTEGGSQLLPHAPDAAVVAEPTLLNVVVAHKGVVRWRCHTEGRAAHSSQPLQGDNAIYRMSRVLQVLENYAKEVVGTLNKHPLVGIPTLSVGTIAGGISVNTVPDKCVIEIDRRVLPGDEPLAVRQHVLDYLAKELGSDFPIRHDEAYIKTRGLSDDNNQDLAARLSRAARQHGGPGERIGVPFGTDAAAFCPFAPTVVFGPGSIAQAHTCDEWLEIEQLQKAADILYEFASAGI